MTRLHGGGAERQMLLLARELRPTHDIRFLVMRSGGEFARIPGELGIEALHLGWHDRPWRKAPIAYVLGVARALVTYVRFAREVDVLEAWLPGAYIFAGLAQPLARVPVLVAGRRTMSDINLFRRRFRRILAALAMRRVDAVVANSEAVARDAIRTEGLPPARVRVIRNGVDMPTDDPEVLRQAGRALWVVSDREFLIGCVANCRPGKGPETVVGMADRLRDVRESMRVVVVGDGPLRPALERSIVRLGLDGMVTLHGAHEDARRLYPAFDIVVQASDSEGLPNAVLEAAAWGRPIVATDAGGTREIVRHGVDGVLVPRRDPDSLADAVLGLVRDPRTREELGRAARRRAVEFSPRRLAEETAALYRELLAVKRPSPGQHYVSTTAHRTP